MVFDVWLVVQANTPVAPANETLEELVGNRETVCRRYPHELMKAFDYS